jgi:hypothetical protein
MNNIYKYYASFSTSRTYSSEEVHISGILQASSCEEALEKSKLAVSSRLDEIYESLESISAKILYSSVDYDYRSCTLGGKETKDAVKQKILDKIEVEEASIFTLEITGHWE